jgi:hypothetical protein
MRPAIMHYPVHYSVEQPERFTRVQLGLRVAAFIVIGLVGLSVGLILAIAYVGLAAFAALRLGASDEGRAPYHEEDGPRVMRGLAWFAAIFAWLGLVTDRLPQRGPDQLVRLEIDPDAARGAELTTSAALMRLLVGLPSALALAVLYFIGIFVWLWSAIRILVEERVGDTAHAYLTGVQRWTLRLLAYQAYLVEPYPPFGFEDEPPRRPVEQSA